MKAKLVKHTSGYILYDEEGITIGAEPNVLSSNVFSKLSLKNCQAIERGYDLDDLAEEWVDKNGDKWSNNTNEVGDNYGSFKAGFQKALELMGDKKFSEEDVMLGWDAGVMSQSICFTNYFGLKRESELKSHRESYQGNLKPSALQQTEWDVEIEMICPHPSDTYRCGIQYGCDGDGCNHPNQIPYLDADGCLILKRI